MMPVFLPVSHFLQQVFRSQSFDIGNQDVGIAHFSDGHRFKLQERAADASAEQCRVDAQRFRKPVPRAADGGFRHRFLHAAGLKPLQLGEQRFLRPVHDESRMGGKQAVGKLVEGVRRLQGGDGHRPLFDHLAQFFDGGRQRIEQERLEQVFLQHFGFDHAVQIDDQQGSPFAQHEPPDHQVRTVLEQGPDHLLVLFQIVAERPPAGRIGDGDGRVLPF